jgi:serine/threonine protein kinase
MEGDRTGKSTTPMPPPGIHEYAFERGQLLLDRFEVLEPLGVGGVGEVYRVRDHWLGEEVALKIVLRGSLRAVDLERVRREVAIARKLSHPNILKYYDLHEFDRGLALGMEWVRGSTLQDLLDRGGPLDENTIRAILPQIVEAMEHLHANEIVHRDIKPSNLFIGDDGTVKLGDFGIVHTEGAEGLTLTGEAIGTPTYMSPEQIQGKNLTPAADYYSLGITLYELASGRVPFEGTYGEVASAHLHQPLSGVCGLPLSAPLKRLILGLLDKRPERRWGAIEARHYCTRRRLPLLPQQRRRAVIAAAIICLAGGAAFLAPRSLARTRPLEVTIEGRTVSCAQAGRLRWQKKFDSAVLGHVLMDVDGDEADEVILGLRLRVSSGSSPSAFPTWKASGDPGPPLFLNTGHLLDSFGAHSPNYRAIIKRQKLFSKSQDDLVISLQHETFYPFYLAIWSAEQRKEILSLEHPGWINQIERWKDGLAIWGGNARLLHLTCLALTGPVGREGTADGLGLGGAQPNVSNLRAYYLLENFNTGSQVAEMSPEGSIQVPSSKGDLVLRDDNTLEGMGPGASNRSLHCLHAVLQVREQMNIGRWPEAASLIEETRRIAEESGLQGWELVMKWLDAERLAREGDIEGAVKKCFSLVKEHPTRAQELPVWAGYYRYLAGDFAGARTTWLGHPSAALVGGGKEWELYPACVFASLLEGVPDDRLRAMIEEYSAGMEQGYYWRRFLAMQRGWIPLLRGDPAAAIPVLKGALTEPSFEPHAAGYFLARILTGTYDPAEMEAYAGKQGGNPLYLQWIAAVGVGDRDRAKQCWRAIELEAWESQDTALMVPVINRLRGRLKRH